MTARTASARAAQARRVSCFAISSRARAIRVSAVCSAGINMALAETRIRLAISRGDKSPALQTALARIAQAREEMARHDTPRACAALADAVRAVMKPR